MKKLTCVAIIFSLATGLATTVSALELSVAGQYFIQGNYFSNANGDDALSAGQNASNISHVLNALATGVNLTESVNPYDDEAGSMSGWNHTFLFKPTLKVNDKIVVKSDIRFLKDTDFGATGAGGLGIKGERNVDIHKIYMEYISPLGKIRVGRVPFGAWMGTYLNSPSTADRIMWWPTLLSKPWSLQLFTQKGTEKDWYGGNNDSDLDIYEAALHYKTKETRAALAYNFLNDKTNSDLGDTSAPPDGISDSWDRRRSRIKGYIKQTIANWWLEAEFSYDFGDWNDYDVETIIRKDIDVDTFAFQIAAGTSFDNLKVTGLYFYASGDDDLTDSDMKAALLGAASDGTGDGFNPYYILTGDHTGMLNSDEYADDSLMATAGVHCIGILADFSLTDKITLHGALAYAMTAEENGVSDAIVAGGGSRVDNQYGWEVDLGASYKLHDNLAYKIEAGYFNSGNFFKDIATSNLTDEDDIYLLSHSLTMTF
jgi:hypothetical protein